MLEIVIPETEQWDEANQMFIYTKSKTIVLEHSLVSISKWESKWCKTYLSKKEKTYEETMDYIKCMTITQNVDPNVYNCLTTDNLKAIKEYIDSPMTAVYMDNRKNNTSQREPMTSDLIYYYMIAFNIPFECQKWHLNRLLTLINICSLKNQPSKKMSTREIMNRNAALNAARRKKYNTNG